MLTFLVVVSIDWKLLNGADELSQASPSSAVKHVSVVPGKIEFSIHVHMNGDIKDVGIRIKSFLATVSYNCKR